MDSPVTPRHHTVGPITAPLLEATLRPGPLPLRQAWVVRTLAFGRDKHTEPAGSRRKNGTKKEENKYPETREVVEFEVSEVNSN